MPDLTDGLKTEVATSSVDSEAKVLGDTLFSKDKVDSAGSGKFLDYYIGGSDDPKPALIESGYPVNSLAGMAEVGRLITNHQFGWNGNEGRQMTNKEILEKYPKQENLTADEVIVRLNDVSELLQNFGMEGVKEKRIELVKDLSEAIRLAQSKEAKPAV